MYPKSRDVNIIVKLPNYIGDIIACLPSLYCIRDLFPSSRGNKITFLIDRNYVDLLFGHENNYDALFMPDWNMHKVKPWVIRDCLMPNKYDIAISFTRQPRFVYGFYLSRIPWIIAYKSFPFGGLVNHGLKEPKGKLSANYGQKEYYFRLITQTIRKDEHIKPMKVNLLTNPEKHKTSKNIIQNNILTNGLRSKENGCDLSYYVIVPGVSNSRYGNMKRWPLENWSGSLPNPYLSAIPFTLLSK